MIPISSISSLKSRIALALVAIIVPISAVFVGSAVADMRRAAKLDQAFRRNAIAHEARGDYYRFTNGVADAVDSGLVGKDAVAALKHARDHVGALRALDEDPMLADVAAIMDRQIAAMDANRSLAGALPLRDSALHVTMHLEDAVRDYNEREHDLVEASLHAARLKNLTIATLAFLMGALATGVGYFLVRSFFRPITALARAAEQIRREGNYAIRVASRANDEIGALVAGFNEMLDAIQSRDRALEAAQERVMQQNTDLRRLAARDPLTGCLNRRGLNEWFERAVEQGPAGLRVCCIMADVDHFKRVNDRYGHSVGDQVLQACVRSLSRGLRMQDVLARYGGEEFCILLPDTTLEQAVAVAERLRSGVESEVGPAVREIAGLHVTASFGVASGAVRFEILLDDADRMLYTAKAAGRNRVVVQQSETAAA